MKPVVFLDRDGTIIEDAHYPNDPAQVKLIPGAIEGLKLLKSKGFGLIVVSNQSGVARGIISDEQFKAVHARFQSLLNENNVEIDEFLYCFHHPEDPCQCRKPKTGLIPKLIGNEPIDFKNSFAIGDRECDLQLADNLGAKGCLTLTGKGKKTHAALLSDNKLDSYLVGENLLRLAELT